MATTPFFSGKDAVLRLFINGNETILNAKSWDASPNVTKVNDGVNGEDLDRLQVIVNYFEFTASCFMDSAKQIPDILAYYANNDAQVLPYDAAAAIQFKILDGSKRAFVAKEVTVDDCKISNSGRGDRVMISVNFRARYFDAIPTL